MGRALLMMAEYDSGERSIRDHGTRAVRQGHLESGPEMASGGSEDGLSSFVRRTQHSWDDRVMSEQCNHRGILEETSR